MIFHSLPPFFFSCSGHHRALPSFPTRRSSDLAAVFERDLAERVRRREHEGAHELEPGRVGCDHERRDPLVRSEEHTSELQSLTNLVCRLLLEKKKKKKHNKQKK